MVIKLARRGNAIGFHSRITARVTRVAVAREERFKHALVVADADTFSADDAEGYAVLLSGREASEDTWSRLHTPISTATDMESIKDGYIVGIEPGFGTLRILYRPESPHNTIFSTDRCNSNCLMCSQPPKDIDDSAWTAEHLKLIDLIDNNPPVIGISGGEPTLLGKGLIRIVERLKERLPDTYVHMLTNGRQYANGDFVRMLGNVRHPAFVSAVPLYADVAGVHDYVVQAEGAFDETIEGLYNAAEVGLDLEIRVVLHKQTIPRLPQLAEYIYRNFPFVKHVALMGMEHMGYVKKNWDALWIDPVDYSAELIAAVQTLHRRRMRVSIYNLPLCLVPRNLWAYARKSISDFKNIYLSECTSCAVQHQCSGLFLSQENRHSANIKAVPTQSISTDRTAVGEKRQFSI